MNKKNGKRGSLTIEAVIAFSVFVSFMFMLLSMVKISLVKITLENAVAETAKYIATASYPIGMFNDICDDEDKKLVENVAKYKYGTNLIKDETNTLFSTIFAETDKGVDKALKDGGTAIFDTVNTFVRDTVIDFLLQGCQNLIEKKAPEFTAGILQEIIDNSYAGIDKNNLTITVVKLPVSKNNFETGYNSEGYTELGLVKNVDYNKDDVVIGVEYIYKLSLPFITTIDVKMRESAVEHGWVNGGANAFASRNEGIKIDSLFGNYTVYVTKQGKKYHTATCFFLRKSKIEMTKQAAIENNYKPCKRCNP